MKHAITITLLSALLPVAGHITTAARADDQRPNVLFVIADDLRDELACYGADHIHSPNIDRLASCGTVFHRAYCQYALCGPSRASLFTGRYPDRIGVLGNKTHPANNRSRYVGTIFINSNFS